MRYAFICISLAFAVAGCGGGSGHKDSVQFSASGEELALGGYGFPPADADAARFVDGWEVRFTKVIAVFDQVTLSENPDLSPTDQSKTGKKVAEINGPWAVDLHRGGPLLGKGGGDEQAYPIELITASLDPASRYAFGFRSVAATAATHTLQIDAGDPDYAEMVAKGWNVLYAGTATWHGDAQGVTCSSTNPAYDFAALPRTVKFRFGFATPTAYTNCQNPDNDPAAPLGSEEHERGVQVKENQTTVAQVTFHVDHPFWESFEHDTPAHFDQLAALAKVQTDGSYLVTLDDTVGVDPKAFVDGAGKPLPWRACVADYDFSGKPEQMGFSTLSIPVAAGGDPATTIRDYRDYMAYNQSTQGHLNSDGLCAVQRSYPSPQ